jgi:hypothetical protein
LGVDWGYGFDTFGVQDASGVIRQQLSGAQFHFTIGQQFR